MTESTDINLPANIESTNSATLLTGTKKIVRYPLYVNNSEKPHRLYPLADVWIQMSHVILFIVLLEVSVVLWMPFGIPPEAGCAVLALFPLSVVFARIFLRNTRITVSDEGISFPLLMYADLCGRLSRPWSDIDTVDVYERRDSLNYVNGNVLSMTFKSGGRIDLDTTRIPRDDLRVLQESLAQHRPTAACAPALTELVARNDFEILDTQMYVFSKKRRQLLSSGFGLINRNPLSTGESILDGGFRIERVLSGSGATCSYLANDNTASRNVCLTEYDLTVVDLNLRDHVAEQLLSTSQVYENLHVPSILNLFDSRVDGDRFYTIAEPISQTLRTRVDSTGPLSDKTTLALGLKLAEALSAFQKMSPSHCIGGIRPDAVSYARDGALSIGEFGFVQDILMKYTETLLVDAPYAAPERIAADPVPASDLYSIGATMYFALTGQDPIPCASGHAQAANSKVSAQLSAVIERLLSTEPEQRGSIQQLIYELGGVAPAMIGAESG